MSRLFFAVLVVTMMAGCGSTTSRNARPKTTTPVRKVTVTEETRGKTRDGRTVTTKKTYSRTETPPPKAKPAPRR